MKSITVTELHELIRTGKRTDLIDVRTPGEYAAIHVPGTRLFPLDQLDCLSVLAEFGDVSDAPLYVFCHGGTRAGRAAEKFARAGFNDCVVVEGGTAAWASAGYPVNRTKRRVLPLDRQLQMVMGIIVLTGVLLSILIHRNWIFLSGFVGAGLIFAGTTGLCPMRSLIARMPWNQESSPTSKTSSGCA